MPARQRDRLGRGQVGVQRAVALGQQLVREIGDRHPQMALAEVDPGDHARLAVQRDQDRRTPDRRALRRVHGLGGLDDEAGGLQVADDRGHRRGRERGTAREIGARHGTGLGQHPDDARSSVAA